MSSPLQRSSAQFHQHGNANATGFIRESGAPFFTLPFLFDGESPPRERLREEAFDLGDNLVCFDKAPAFLFLALPVIVLVNRIC